MSLRLRSLFALSCFLGSVLLVSCSGDQASPGGHVSLAGPPPITLHDPSPKQLSLFVALQIGGYDVTTRDQTTMYFGFSSQGRVVRFAGNEQLTCNGRDVPLHSQQDGTQITALTSTLSGQTQHCIYRAGQASTAFTFVVPQTPTITTPQDQAQLPRSKNTLIVYDTHGETPMGIVALASPGKAIAHLDTPSPGQATIDTSTFPKGAGSIVLTETLTIPVSQNAQVGPPFASLGARADVNLSINVTWI